MDIKEARKIRRRVYKELAEESYQQRVRMALLIKRGVIAMPPKKPTFTDRVDRD